MIKIGVIGTGFVGSAYAYSLVTQGVVDELVLIDRTHDVAHANALDIIHGTNFLPRQPKIYAGQYSDLKNADIVCITSGAAQKLGQTRLDLINVNKKIIIDIMKNIKMSGFNGIIIVASNPVDILTHIIIQECKWPKAKVMGSGTVFDTARFKSNLANYFGFNPSQIHANIIGEHGDSSVPIISTARIANRPILDIINDSNGKYTIDGVNKCYEEARNAADIIISGKGATYYGIGTALVRITKAIVNNENMILPVSTLVMNEYDGINDVCIAVPCVINNCGVREIFYNKINNHELQALQNSANKLKVILNEVNNE